MKSLGYLIGWLILTAPLARLLAAEDVPGAMPDVLYFKEQGIPFYKTTEYWLTRDGLMVRRDDQGDGVRYARRQFTIEAWQAFLARVRPLKVQSWKPRYEPRDPNADDGAWCLRWISGSMHVESDGFDTGPAVGHPFWAAPSSSSGKASGNGLFIEALDDLWAHATQDLHHGTPDELYFQEAGFPSYNATEYWVTPRAGLVIRRDEESNKAQYAWRHFNAKAWRAFLARIRPLHVRSWKRNYMPPDTVKISDGGAWTLHWVSGWMHVDSGGSNAGPSIWNPARTVTISSEMQSGDAVFSEAIDDLWTDARQ